MPYDGQNFDTKPDLSLDGLIQWLEGRDPETEYDFLDHRDCLLTRFGRAHGEKRIAATAPYAAQVAPDVYWGATRLEGVACGYPRTYGAALERARALRGS